MCPSFGLRESKLSYTLGVCLPFFEYAMRSIARSPPERASGRSLVYAFWDERGDRSTLPHSAPGRLSIPARVRKKVDLPDGVAADHGQ
jgi:hypothetical protein